MLSAKLRMVVFRPCWFIFSPTGSPFGECACGPLGFRGGGRRGVQLGIVVEALGGFLLWCAVGVSTKGPGG